MKNIINKSEIYYVYIASKNKSCYIGNKENLIYYLSKGYRQSYWDNRDENIYFRDINASGKDSYVSYLERKTDNNTDNRQDSLFKTNSFT